MATVDTSEVSALVIKLDQFDEITDRETKATMLKSLALFESAVIVETPVNVGNLRSSISSEMRRTARGYQGKVTSPLLYVSPVEFGRRPGKPPPTSAIKLWVIRKLGVSSAEADSVAFMVARSIGKRGTKGAFMFEKGYKARLSSVLRLWDNLADRIARKI